MYIYYLYKNSSKKKKMQSIKIIFQNMIVGVKLK